MIHFDSPSGAAIYGDYRYSLWRPAASDGKGSVAFVMLNPSTADATTDDPTIRRCVGFASRWGYATLLVVNLFALRSTAPEQVLIRPDPVGLANDVVIDHAASLADRVIAAWGSFGSGKAKCRVRERALHVEALITKRTDLYALGATKDGHPRHPLYLRGDAEPGLYRMREIAP